MSSESKKNNDDIEESNQETLDSIETSLGAIEAQLRPSLERQSGGRSVHETTGIGMMGRSVRESIQSALGSLRSRLDTVHEEQQDESTRIGLERRLRNAELAHSNRIPLNVLQRELSRRQSTTTSEFTHKEQEEHAPSNSNRRRSSVLMASRRMAAAVEGPQADMDLHGTSMQALPVENEDKMEVEEVPNQKPKAELNGRG